MNSEALHRYVERIVSSRTTLQAIVQDVFSQPWRRWGFDAVGPGIQAHHFAAYPKAVNYSQRDDSAERARPKPYPHGILSEEPALPEREEAQDEAEDITHAITKALEGMPPRQREVTALRLRHQLTTAEIARRLGISQGTVEAHIARATKALREKLPSLLSSRS